MVRRRETHVDRSRCPVLKLPNQFRKRGLFDGDKPSPVHAPGRRGARQDVGKHARRLQVQQRRTRPVRRLNRIWRRLRGGELADHERHREPLGRRPLKLVGEVDRRNVETLLLSGGAVQVEQRQPFFDAGRRIVVVAEPVEQTGFCALVVPVGETDGRLLQLGVVGILGHLDGRGFRI